MDRKFDFDDISITPKTHTDIRSRYSEIDPHYSYLIRNAYLERIHTPLHYPIFTAPMDSVVDFSNMDCFWRNNIAVTLPRTLKHEDFLAETEWDIKLPDYTFFSYGLDEFEKYFISEHNKHRVPTYVLIDVANGHMKDIDKLVKEAKKYRSDIIVMIGNVANPDTYLEYAKTGVVDLIRVGIGNGNGCLTTKQTGVGYPNASLVRECYLTKQEVIKHHSHKDKVIPKIIADGGMKDYADVIKALALGADYVMIGSIFNKAIESKGKNYWHGIKLPQSLAENIYKRGFSIEKQFYGMSTKIAQKRMGKTRLKTSEGVVRYRKVEYTLNGWRENFDSYLRSTMSYCNAKTLNDFIGKADINLITENAYNRFNK